MPAGFADGTDDVGITEETDPEVGSIATNRIPKWNGDQLVSSEIHQSADGNVGIGTTSPSQKLEVNGNLEMTGATTPNWADSGDINAKRLCIEGDCRTSWSGGFPGTYISSTDLSSFCRGSGGFSGTFTPPANAKYGLVYAKGGTGSQGQECGLSGVLIDHADAWIYCRDTGNVVQNVNFEIQWGSCSGQYVGPYYISIVGKILWYK